MSRKTKNDYIEQIILEIYRKVFFNISISYTNAVLNISLYNRNRRFESLSSRISVNLFSLISK